MKYFKDELDKELTHTLKLALVILLMFSTIFIQDVQASTYFGSRDLSVGETWNLGNGFSITAYVIDAKATPKQAWLILDDSGVKLDDNIIREGEVYTYSGTTVIFSTTAASIWSGPSSDMIRLANTYTEQPASSSGSITVSSSPSDASIYLDGVYWGTTTSTMTIAAGSHTITLKLTGYQDWSQTVDVVAGQTYSLSPQLNPILGSISVSSSHSGASIYLDGSYQGTAPKTLTNIETGSHTLTLKLTGYQDWSQTINVASGQTYSLSPQLTPVPPVTTATITPITTTPAPPVTTATITPVPPVPTSTPPLKSSNSYIYGIVIIAIALVVVATLRRRFSYQETKPVKTRTKVIPKPSVKHEPEPVPETLQPSIPKEEQKLHKCPYCGAEVLESDLFCGECGKPLRS